VVVAGGELRDAGQRDRGWRRDRIKSKADDYDTCASASDASTCDQFFTQNGAIYNAPTACDTFKLGQVPPAGACTLDEDCETASNSCDAGTHTCG